MRTTETRTPAQSEGIDLSAGRLVSDVIRDLNRQLATELNSLGESGFGWPHSSVPEGELAMPARWAWIACYAVRGGSEAYWVHIDLIKSDGITRRNIGMCKIWSWHAAFTLCNAATRLLHDW
jgi:hypothetical protein